MILFSFKDYSINISFTFKKIKLLILVMKLHTLIIQPLTPSHPASHPGHPASHPGQLASYPGQLVSHPGHPAS